MPKYEVGDHLQVKLSGGKLTQLTTEDVRLQVSFSEETTLIYP